MTIQHTARLSTKFIRIGMGLLIVALLSIGITIGITLKLEGGAAAVNEAGRLRMQTWRLSSAVLSGSPAVEVAQLRKEFNESLSLLREGDAKRPLFMPQSEEVRQRFAEVDRLWQGHTATGYRPGAPGQQELMVRSELLVVAIDDLVLAIERNISRQTGLLNLFQLLMMLLAIAGAVLMLYTGYLYVLNPLAQLRQALGRIESGDFSARVAVDTNDEFGQVAAGFNRMGATLRELYSGLEQQVQAKTQRLESQRARLEALYEISTYLASGTQIEELARGFNQRLRNLMRADAVALRWTDDAHQRYRLLSAEALSHDMTEAERSVIAGVCECGNLNPCSQTRVIPIHALDGMPQRECVKAGYTAIISVPVRLQSRILGEITLFYQRPVELTADERELLDACASHLASSMEGLRAAALDRESAVGEERSLLARELHDSIAQSLSFLKIQIQMLKGAIDANDRTKISATLAELESGIRESTNDVRELLVHFRTRVSSDDIETAIQETAQKFRHQTGLAIRVVSEGDGLPLPADVQVQILHILQEALSNIRKHAKAQSVMLKIIRGEQWRFVVQDDGMGFDQSKDHLQTHVGINIMRERAKQIDARLSIASAPVKGTEITLTLPRHPVTTITDNASRVPA